jgi:predicted aspartyl protease
MQPTFRTYYILSILLLLLTIKTSAKVIWLPGEDSGIKRLSFPELRLDKNARDSMSFVLPFSRAGNLLLIKASADSTSGNFILDTGCPGLVLNITYFRHYASVVDYDNESMGMSGTAEATEHVLIRDFALGSMREHNVKANLANLGNIENAKGVKILGLVGLQFLTDCEVIIDYETNLMYFHVIARKESSSYQSIQLADTAAYHTIPFEIANSKMIVRNVVAGKKLRFVIDCAAETNILDSRLPDKIFDDLMITGKILLNGVGTKKVEAVKGNLSSFSIGQRIIKDMPVIVTNLEKTCLSYGGCVDGVLGLDNLSAKKIGFNFSTFKMFIWK